MLMKHTGNYECNILNRVESKVTVHQMTSSLCMFQHITAILDRMLLVKVSFRASYFNLIPVRRQNVSIKNPLSIITRTVYGH